MKKHGPRNVGTKKLSMKIDRVYGVDFSGAKLAGVNIWIALVEKLNGRPQLVSLDRLGALAGNDERAVALGHLVSMISASKAALWGIDFPFALPLEVVKRGWTFDDQLNATLRFVGDAYGFGNQCCDAARALGGKLHIRRSTDVETKTPFDCYHYRIICQTFHGMRDVLRPLRSATAMPESTPVPVTAASNGDAGVAATSRGTIIAPFDLPNPNAHRAVVETCPGSTLKRWGVPHNNYKQPAGGPLEPKRIRNRRIILAKLHEVLDIEPKFVRIMQRNPGGDALDAVIAAIGTWQAWSSADWDAIAAHPRYRLEGRIFA